MAEESRRPTNPLTAIAAGAVFLFLSLSLYVLSIGPAEWLYHHRVINARTILFVYHPVYSASKSHPTLAEARGWYTELWIGNSSGH